MNTLETIFLFFAFLALMLALLFFIRKKGDRVANRILGMYLLLFSYNIVYNVLYWTKELYNESFLYLVSTNKLVWLLYGPLLYLYVKRIVKKKGFSFLDLIHFIPFLFFTINIAPFLLLSKELKINVLVNNLWSDHLLFYQGYGIEIIVSLMFGYATLILWSLRNQISSLNQRSWLLWLGNSFLGYVVSFTSYFVFQSIGWIEVGYDHFIGFSMIFFIGLVAYFGFVQPQVFDGLSMDQVLPIKKYSRTGLTESHSKELKSILMSYMNTQKPHLNSELKLELLADQLNLSRHHMSQVINEHFDMNFFDYINSHRINEAKDLLANSPSLSITDILYSSGFSNRVSFNKAFKKQTGTTPSHYRSKIQNAISS